MSLKLIISLIIYSIILIYITTIFLRNGKIPIKYSLPWYFCAIIILVLAVLPFIIEFIANILGFQTLSNLIIGVIISSLLLFLTMSLTIIISGQNKKITLLIQEVSMLKQKERKERK